ncbi:uncharacterized protein LOC124176949 [Neodiprion fabricii]|uniref:uncharacterized protein LOC124176949 n=1 Tax=Neodiprion fabricii TaxID=2872261 RepID=UPI001ED91B7D|nr:uncharacterized protein LOC124176949 [Neodiprion fabricii]
MQTLNSEPIVEYLEKYAVAPSPSRDYYGIKVLKDQVTDENLKYQFTDRDRLLQHVRDIVQGKEGSLLTLPKNLIKKITVYLGLKDVLNLAKVSRMANEVFDGDGVWEVLYKRHKMGLVCRDEREQGSSHGWKKLFKERQLHKPARDRKVKIKKTFQRSSPPQPTNWGKVNEAFDSWS